MCPWHYSNPKGPFSPPKKKKKKNPKGKIIEGKRVGNISTIAWPRPRDYRTFSKYGKYTLHIYLPLHTSA